MDYERMFLKPKNGLSGLFNELDNTIDDLVPTFAGLLHQGDEPSTSIPTSSPYIPTFTEKYLAVERWGILNYVVVGGVITVAVMVSIFGVKSIKK